MGFGKKKKEKKGKKPQPKAIIKYNKKNNPLYPEKIESDGKAVIMAFGTVLVAILLVGVIIMNFSYAIHPEKLQAKTVGNTVGQNEQGQSDQMVGNPAESEEGLSDVENQDMENEASGIIEEGNQEGQSGAVSNTIGIPAEEEQTTQAADPPEDSGDSSYIIADSSTRYLTKEDVAGLSKEQLRYARNEIYARHGRRFNDAALQSYFDSKSWYQGTIAPEAFDESVLSQCERDNIDLIKKYE